MRDKLLILNFDQRCAGAVAMKLRAERIFCQVLPGDTPYEQVMAQDARGLVLAGGVSGELPGMLVVGCSQAACLCWPWATRRPRWRCCWAESCWSAAPCGRP